MDETVKQGRFDKQELLKKAENFCNKLEEEESVLSSSFIYF